MIRTIFTITLIMLFHISLNAQGSDLITGFWITPGAEAIIQIEKESGHYVGKILRIHPEGYINGIAPKDVLNADSNLRSRSLEGITILSGIRFDNKKKTWQVKQLYDPDRGKYYEGFIVMQGSDRLKLRGHVPGKKWLGETEIWKRREDSSF